MHMSCKTPCPTENPLLYEFEMIAEIPLTVHCNNNTTDGIMLYDFQFVFDVCIYFIFDRLW